MEGHVAVVKLLLESKADTSIRGKDGRTALTWSEKGGHD